MSKSVMKKRLIEAQSKINKVANQFSPTFRNNFTVNDRNKMLKLCQDVDKLIEKLK